VSTTGRRTSTGRVLSAVAGAVVIVVLVGRLGVAPFLQALSGATVPALAAALAVGAATTGLSALRWVRAARLLGLALPPARALSDYYAAVFLNAVLPGGVLGDVRRAVLHGRTAGSVRRAAGALLLERCAGQLVLVAAAAAVWLARPSSVPGPASVSRAVAVALGVAALAAAVRLARVLPPRWIRDLVVMLGASVAVLSGHVAMFVLAARAAGVRISVAALLPLALVALLAMSLPLNVAGWGPREGATAWAFASAGLGAGRGVTVAVLYGLFALVGGLPGAVVLLSRPSVPIGRPSGPILEPGRQPIPQQDQVVEPADVGQHRAAVVVHGEPARARQAGRTRLADEERRDGHLELVDDTGVQEGAQGDLASLDEQPANTPLVQVGEH
jgi:uncharacterized membrane protein YbhN (UPF0104 family)